MEQTSTRAGTFLNQPTGYKAFIPKPLNPIPAIKFDQDIAELLAEASLRLGKLDGIGQLLPNPDLFVSIFVRQEALLSSQIEGTQCTLDEVLDFPIEEKQNDEVEEVINYVSAMNHGLMRLRDANGMPLSRRLLCEIHEILLDGSRGSTKTPGEVRTSQNWIGGTSISTATFIPPPVEDMNKAFSDLEKFLHVKSGISPLIQVAVAHAQFETIHPFLDGNGRLGRLLITLLMCEKGLLKQPLLYLSHYLKANQFEYYKRLTAIRYDGDWENWIKFFLEGVIRVGDQSINNAAQIISLLDEHRKILHDEKVSVLGLDLLDYLCEQPKVTLPMVEKKLGCAYMTAKSLVDDFEKLSLLKETTGFKRNKRYEYAPYLNFWREAQDDYGTIDEDFRRREKFKKAIESLRSGGSLELKSSASWKGWKVLVDKIEICTLEPWSYEKLMEPMRLNMDAPLEERKNLTAKLIQDAANLLEKMLIEGPEKEFDETLEYELSAMGHQVTVNVFEEDSQLKLRLLNGDIDRIFSDAGQVRIPWEFHFKNTDTNRVQKKTASITHLGMDVHGTWMTILPEEN